MAECGSLYDLGPAGDLPPRGLLPVLFDQDIGESAQDGCEGYHAQHAHDNCAYRQHCVHRLLGVLFRLLLALLRQLWRDRQGVRAITERPLLHLRMDERVKGLPVVLPFLLLLGDCLPAGRVTVRANCRRRFLVLHREC